jgi:hypothetical protein
VTTSVEDFSMGPRTKLVGVILCVAVLVFFAAWPVWKWIENKPVSDSLYERTRAVVEKNPRLQPAWDIAMQDGVLTWREARVILESAGEKLDAKE